MIEFEAEVTLSTDFGELCDVPVRCFYDEDSEAIEIVSARFGGGNVPAEQLVKMCDMAFAEDQAGRHFDANRGDILGVLLDYAAE